MPSPTPLTIPVVLVPATTVAFDTSLLVHEPPPGVTFNVTVDVTHTLEGPVIVGKGLIVIVLLPGILL